MGDFQVICNSCIMFYYEIEINCLGESIDLLGISEAT